MESLRTFPRHMCGHTGTHALRNRLLSYSVTGRGHFPLDMLRYDMAHPVGSYDSLNIDDNTRKPRTVTLNAFRCTPARWASFGWYVSDTIDEFAQR